VIGRGRRFCYSPASVHTRSARPSIGLLPFLLLGAVLTSLGSCRSADKPISPPPAAAPPTAPAASSARSDGPAGPPAADNAGDLYFGVIEPHFERVTIYRGPLAFLDEYRKTPERARNLLTAHWAASEISSGGFLQLFTGAAGVLAPEAVRGLDALGLGQNARILEEAMALLGPRYPREMEKRQRLVAARKRQRKLENPFADLDERFFESLRRHPGGFNAVAASYAGKR
jgi:hypothetical protein